MAVGEWRVGHPLASEVLLAEDIRATIDSRARAGVATPPVLVPARRNIARLMLMIDRQGSMVPYHGIVQYVRRSMNRAGRLNSVPAVYFHDVPGRVPDRSILAGITDPLLPQLDSILRLVQPLDRGRLYADPALTGPLS